jgi:hypothetical protein
MTCFINRIISNVGKRKHATKASPLGEVGGV